MQTFKQWLVEFGEAGPLTGIDTKVVHNNPENKSVRSNRVANLPAKDDLEVDVDKLFGKDCNKSRTELVSLPEKRGKKMYSKPRILS